MATPTTPGRGYKQPHPSNLLSQDVLRISDALLAIDTDVSGLLNLLGALDAAAVRLTGSQTIAGVKTFSSSPVVPDLPAGENSTKAVNAKFVQAAVAALVNSSPATLDTLNELATALGNDPNFATTITAALATKADAAATVAALSGKADAAATTTALAGKAALSHTHTAGQVAGGPAFSAYLNATQTVSNGVATKMALNAETFDTDNCFDTTTYRFQPTLAGYYFFTGRLSGAAATSGTIMTAQIYKNGVSVKQGQPYIPPSGSSSMTVTISGLVYLNGTTDYVELYGTNSGSGTNTFSAGATVSFFDGYFVRP